MAAANPVWALLERPENRLAVKATLRLARGLERGSTPIALLTLHGPAGTGKSLVIDRLLERSMTGPVTARRLPASELRDDDRQDLLETDLLIIEDLHHLPAAAMEGLCFLLDHRQRRRRTTVVTLNAAPSRVRKLSRPLLQRLTGGLTIPLTPYTTASKLALAEAYAEHVRLRIEPEALAWLAARPSHGSVRPVLGALDQLHILRRGNLAILTLREVKDLITAEPAARPVETIIRRVAETFGVKAKEMLGPSRLKGVLLPRQVAMFLARDVASLSLPRIGAHFGGRDHTTVRHAVNKIRDAISDDRTLAGTIRQLKLELA